MSSNTLTVTDNRTGKSYELAITNGAIRAMDLRQIKTGSDDFGLMTYDPAFMNTASARARSPTSMAIGASCATAAIRSRSWPSTAPSWKWPTCSCTANCRPRQSSKNGSAESRTTPCSTKTSRSSWRLPLRRPPHGHAGQHGGGALHLLSGSQEHARPRGAATADRPADRQDADPGRLSPTATASGCPTSIRTTTSSYTENFMNMLWKMTEPKYRAQPGAGARPRCAVHPACRPRAELQHQRHARGGQFAGRSVPLHGRGHARRSPGRCTAAPTKKCCACWTRSASQGQHPGLHRAVKEGQAS